LVTLTFDCIEHLVVAYVSNHVYCLFVLCKLYCNVRGLRALLLLLNIYIYIYNYIYKS